jgi:hypothetical protein
MLFDWPALLGALFERAHEDAPRVPTGYASLDAAFRGGFAPGHLVEIIARPEVGKTYFACNLAANMADVPALFISLEMGAADLAERLVGVLTGEPGAAIDAELAHAPTVEESSYAGIPGLPRLMVAEPRERTWSAFSGLVGDFFEATGERPRLIFVDCLTYIQPEGFRGPETTRIGEAALAAKSFAKDHGATLILLHHIPRAGRGDSAVPNEGQLAPYASDALYAGEREADVMLGLYAPSREPAPADDRKREAWERRIEAATGALYVNVCKSRMDAVTPDARFPGFRLRWEAGGRLVEDDRRFYESPRLAEEW